MNASMLRDSIRAATHFAFSRSGGPGGQNVNKTSTKVDARVALADLAGLTLSELERARTLLAARIVNDEVCVVSSEERYQLENRERALLRLEMLISSAARLPKRRIPTRPTGSSVKRRHRAKENRSTIKSARKTPDSED
ncbi:MAG: hypothetical protein A2Z99_10985 [Treponema sp. GWB1_62_6]|nr:MAG: hypothetical protein A2Z99_10985 [Treponema sp. GWB1_62_6]OHE70349.1 MAG: hypothetical protein A2413_15030 [Treponema sp. RIFOXYC1_FULL_61_9]